MADYDRSTSPVSTQGVPRFEIVDAVLTRIQAAEILEEKYLQIRRQCGISNHLATEMTREDVLRILRRAYFSVCRGSSDRARIAQRGAKL